MLTITPKIKQTLDALGQTLANDETSTPAELLEFLKLEYPEFSEITLKSLIQNQGYFLNRFVDNRIPFPEIKIGDGELDAYVELIP